MSTATKPEPPKYDFSAKIPNIPDLKSSGEIMNLTAIQNLTVTVPRRVSNINGMKTVSLLHPEINNITFLFIQPSEHSDECRKLICRPVGSSQTGTAPGQSPTSGPYSPAYTP